MSFLKQIAWFIIYLKRNVKKETWYVEYNWLTWVDFYICTCIRKMPTGVNCILLVYVDPPNTRLTATCWCSELKWHSFSFYIMSRRIANSESNILYCDGTTCKSTFEHISVCLSLSKFYDSVSAKRYLSYLRTHMHGTATF